MAVRLSGRLDVDALEQSFREVVRRHEVLRTTFKTVDGQPVQVIAESQAVSLRQVDLSHLREAERERAANLWIAKEEAESPFDLSRGPLLRVTLLKLSENE